ncbi:YfbM family protein [Luteibacter sp. NPDC031894]|jgi:hypothetical protein|uniref:YfbM family protein n=1 Tax=Luteibacter sp. NPDC031894 TaxID=3390572 RepID=UPI003CFCD625
MSMIGRFERIDEDRAERLSVDPAEQAAFFERGGEPGPEMLDVDKAWHAIHFSLTGEAWPNEDLLSMAIFGGEPFGDDLGYGPPRMLHTADVRSVAEALAAVDPPTIASQLDMARLESAEVYPGAWLREEASNRDYIAHHLQRLRAFYSEAAVRNEAVILWLA